MYSTDEGKRTADASEGTPPENAGLVSAAEIAGAIVGMIQAAGAAHNEALCEEALRLASQRLRGFRDAKSAGDTACHETRAPIQGERRREIAATLRPLWPYEDLELEPIEWGE